MRSAVDWLFSFSTCGGCRVDWFNWSIIGVGATCVSAIAAVFALLIHSAVGNRATRAHVIAHCNSRYDDLVVYRTLIPSDATSDDPRIISYFRRYWGLKSDQIDYWLAGSLDPETLSSWLMSTVDALQSKERHQTHVGDKSYKDSWKDIKVWHEAVNPTFAEIMKNLAAVISDQGEKQRYADVFIILRDAEKAIV